MTTWTYQVGAVRLHLISDGTFWTDGGGNFGVVPRILWEKVIQPDALNRIPMDLRSLLIESGEGLILVDTGHGHKLTPKRREQLGLADDTRVDNRLEELGFRREDVRLVINTHLHADHCSGNTVFGEDGQILPTYPRATYLMQRLELADATYPNERTRNTYFCENFLPLLSLCDNRGNSAVRILSGDSQITPEVRVQVAAGHTRSHQIVIIESRGECAAFLGDAASHAVNLERLAWVPAFDAEPLVSIETKRGLRDWALRRDVLLLFQHDTEIPAGHLLPEGDGVRVEPAEAHQARRIST